MRKPRLFESEITHAESHFFNFELYGKEQPESQTGKVWGMRRSPEHNDSFCEKTTIRFQAMTLSYADTLVPAPADPV